MNTLLYNIKKLACKSILIALPLYRGVGGGLLSLCLVGGSLLCSCSDLSDQDHYKQFSTDINSDELLVVDMTSEQYLSQTADYSSMNKLFQDYKIYDKLNEKGQLSTILVVPNSAYQDPTGSDSIKANTVKAHISDVAMSPANLKTENNDLRIMMWHGKYINVDLDSLARTEGKIANHIMFNTSAVQKVVKTTSGYIYVLSDMINTPQSLNDFINALDGNYSIIRDTIKASGGKVFDKTNSKPIGVNEEGNTVYDTAWVYTNDHFSEKGIDLTSESLTATMLLCSDSVVTAAIDSAKIRLQQWGLWDSWIADRQYDFEYTMRHWIMDASFFNTKYSSAEITSKDPSNLLTSIFSKTWKTSAQTVDATPIELSNGVVYKVKHLHIPNNVLIWRLKNEFNVYEACTADQKESWFKMTNMQFSKMNTDVAAWTPLSGAWPLHENRVLILKPGDDASGEWQLDFTPCKRIYETYYDRSYMVKKGLLPSSLNVADIQMFLIPPGKYRFAMGFKQNMNMDVQVYVYAKGVAAPIGISSTITLGSATTYHYDRGATLSNTYMEGYDTNQEGLSSKKGNYDTDGGLVIDELNIPDVYGDGSPVQLTFSIMSPGWGSQTAMYFNHWCLRPTADNY